MTAYLVIILLTVGASALTFLTGFGLGTLLLPAFMLFFPVRVAIAATAIVHLANNLFKAALVGKHADWGVVARFGLPAVAAAMAGALLLDCLSGMPPLLRYEWLGAAHAVTPVKLLIAMLMAMFAWLDLSPRFQDLAFPARWLPAGGAISGFFGGLSGHQGALRAAFLIRLGLSKEAFIGTTVMAAILVDVSRLAVYGIAFFAEDFRVMADLGAAGLILAGVFSALVGAIAGSRLMHKVTITTVQRLVGDLLLLYAVLLGFGII